jgi:hypothetical protein
VSVTPDGQKHLSTDGQFLTAKVAGGEFVAVTGIRPLDAISDSRVFGRRGAYVNLVAEFTWVCKPTEVGKMTRDWIPWHVTDSVVEPETLRGAATFRRYDDGWHVDTFDLGESGRRLF